jgi:hypothetical protein
MVSYSFTTGETEMIEIWETIVGYGGAYEVSNMGRVKSSKFRNSRILKPRNTKNGYKRVALNENSRVTNFSVHRLVAIAFIQNTDNLPQVNHIDGNKLNNIVTNLEWCDARHNQLHAISLGLVKKKLGEDHHMSPFKNEDIFSIREAYLNGESQRHIADRYGVCQPSIHAIIARKTWTHI